MKTSNPFQCPSSTYSSANPGALHKLFEELIRNKFRVDLEEKHKLLIYTSQYSFL